MTNTKTLVRPAFTLEEDNLNTKWMDYISIDNAITIPINKKYPYEYLISSYYDCLVDKNSSKFNMSAEEVKELPFDLYLFIKAKEGHSIYNLDKQYNYYMVACITMPNGCTEDLSEQIFDMTDEEKIYIQRLLWNFRPVNDFLQKQVEQTIKEQLPEIQYNLFSHCTMNGDYHAVYRTVDKVLFATVKDYKNGMSPVILEV